MELAKVKVNGVHAQLVSAEDIPRGIVGGTVSIVYEDPVWAGLDKTVVFRGAVTVDVLHAGENVVIPPEVTAHTWTNLQMGIYGMDPEGKTAIPTLWVDLGRIHRAADPCGDPGSGQGLPLWAQLIAMIGDPEDLNTKDKSSLVAAINELAANSGEVDASTIAQLVEEYLSENPVDESDPTVPDWAKQPQKASYTASEVGADPTGTAAAAVTAHNISADSHGDLRLELKSLADRINAALDSDDTTLDELSEIVAYIKANKTLIDSITASKVSVGDIVNNLVTNVTNKPLSAAQGVMLKSLIDAIAIPTKLSQLLNDPGYITGYTETDPTVPDWAKAASKPSYSKSEVGLGNVDNVKQYSASNPPPYPVTSVNGKTGAVKLGASDVGAMPDTYVPPDQTAAQVGADPAGTAGAAVSGHNTADDAHNDIRLELKSINDRLNAFLDSDDKTLDELSEIVAYITSNKTLIDSVTTSKVNVSDIINNLTTNVSNKPLSAAQGVVLKGLIDALTTSLSGYQPKGDYALVSQIPEIPVKSVNGKTGTVSLSASDVGALPSTTQIPAKTSDLTNDSGFLTEETDPTVPAWAKAASKPGYSKSEVGLGNVDNVKQYSTSNPPPYPVTSVNGKTGVVTLGAADVGARDSSWMPTAADVGAAPASQALTVTGVDADGVEHSWIMYGVSK